MRKVVNRNKVIDIMKVCGIVLMVVGHSGFMYTHWIYQFHMALFFIIAGYCYNTAYSENLQLLKKMIVKRLKSLYIPCLLFNITVVVLHNVLYKLYLTGGGEYSRKKTIVSILKCFLFSGGEELSGAMWFLRTMFFCTLSYAIAEYALKKIFKSLKVVKLFKWIFSILCLLVGWRGSYFAIGEYFNILSVVILFHIGNCFRAYNMLEKLQLKNSVTAIIAFVTFTIISVTAYGFPQYSISLNVNKIENPLWFVGCSLVGFFFVFNISCIFSSLKRVSLLLGWIGKHTLIIVMLHFLAMKLVTLIQIFYYHLEVDNLRAFPVLFSTNGWWLVYSIVGVGVPLLLYKAYGKMVSV